MTVIRLDQIGEAADCGNLDERAVARLHTYCP